jgi:integrase
MLGAVSSPLVAINTVCSPTEMEREPRPIRPPPQIVLCVSHPTATQSRSSAFAPELPATPVPDHIPTIPTPEQQDQLMEAIPWDKAGFFLARAYMGLRDEETARAVIGDYAFGEPDENGSYNDRLTVRGKGRKVRILPVDSDVARWVRERHDLRALRAWPTMLEQPLFPNPKATNSNKRWTQASRRRVMLAAMAKVGIRTRPNEALRHCFGTRVANKLLRDGSSINDASRKLMMMMGHTSIETSSRYVKFAAESLRDLVRR